MATTITYTLTAEQEKMLNRTLSGFTTGKTLDNAIGSYINEALNKMVSNQQIEQLQTMATTFKDTTVISTLAAMTSTADITAVNDAIKKIESGEETVEPKI